MGQQPLAPGNLAPDWLKPENASVFDPAYQAPLRALVRFFGLDDPNAVMIGAPLEAGASTGGVLEALGTKFPRLAKAIKAYHGSPHDFEQFDLSKIGTGEGAQAYGHGLYFAENPAVAADYRASLAKPSAESPAWRLRGEPVAFGTDHWQLASILEQGGRPAPNQSTAEFLATRINELEDQARFADRAYGADTGELYRRQATRLRAIDPKDLTFHQPGRTYEVAIHADPDQFLDWDKPLAEQSEQVQRALAPYLQQITETAANAEVKNAIVSGTAKGSQIYHWLGGEQSIRSRFTASPPQAAAETMRSVGVPGLKYYDSGSRTAAGAFSSADRAGADLTRNYVVFDDKLIEILKKYGVFLPAGAATLGAAQPQGQH